MIKFAFIEKDAENNCSASEDKQEEDSGAVVGASMSVVLLTLVIVAGGAFVYYRLGCFSLGNKLSVMSVINHL